MFSMFCFIQYISLWSQLNKINNILFKLCCSLFNYQNLQPLYWISCNMRCWCSLSTSIVYVAASCSFHSWTRLYRMIVLLFYITSRNNPRTLILSFICNLFVFLPRNLAHFFFIGPIKTLFRMMQSSNLVVSIVEHGYRMIALLLYTVSQKN